MSKLSVSNSVGTVIERHRRIPLNCLRFVLVVAFSSFSTVSSTPSENLVFGSWHQEIAVKGQVDGVFHDELGIVDMHIAPDEIEYTYSSFALGDSNGRFAARRLISSKQTLWKVLRVDSYNSVSGRIIGVAPKSRSGFHIDYTLGGMNGETPWSRFHVVWDDGTKNIELECVRR